MAVDARGDFTHSSPVQSLRIGFIGAGGNTKLRHLPGLAEIEGVELAAVSNRSVESARRVADEFGIARVSGDWREIVEMPDIDAVCIGTWPNTHAEMTLAALEAGKHVLTEARMAANAEEALAMLRASHRRPELVCQIVPAPFSLDWDATIARLLPELGTLWRCRIEFSNGQHADANLPRSWRQDIEISGVNTITLGILYETVQRWLGPENSTWVSAIASTFIPERPSSDGGGSSAVTVPDAVSVSAGYASGLQLQADLSTVSSGPPVSQIRIDGARGSLHMDFITNQLTRADIGGNTEQAVAPDPGTTRGWRVEADFVECIRSGAPVMLTNFSEGLRYMRFTELAWKSWNAGGSRLAWAEVFAE